MRVSCECRVPCTGCKLPAATLPVSAMMFNGLLMCTDSDSDFTKESICRSSGPESPDSTCASARARHYQNKLLATLQILHNKEETVRVQAESLAVAEARGAALAARHAGLRRELERKEREIQSLRQNMKECHCKLSRVDTCNAATEAEIQEMDDQKNIVKSLQNNLDVIQELYRECFYESVKQDSLIEMLRQSYLDVRQMDEDKSARISQLRGVIRAQRSSLDRCQDISAEVDNLKMEICNFINSSNNDSGMWEGSVVSGLNEDLQDIAAQLIKLRDFLTGDCTCGLEEENRRLRKENECLEEEMGSLRTQISTLQADLMKKDCQLDRQCQDQIKCKERELSCIREQLQAMMVDVKEKTEICDSLTQQLTDTKASLADRVAELGCMQQQSRIYEDTINVMREELDKTEEITKEVASLRAELCCEARRGARGARRAAQLEGELARAREHCQQVDAAYREKTTNALSLERQLDEAHARGAELCGEAGRVVRAVRCWAARMKEIHREQEKQIKLKENRLRCLQDELHKRQINICPRLWEQIEQTCAARQGTVASSTSGTSCSKISRKSEGSCPTVKFCVGESRHDGTGSSGSEMAGCSTPLPCVDAACPSNEPACPEHVPSCSRNLPSCSPKRTYRTKSACGMTRRYGGPGALAAGAPRGAGAQHPGTPRPAPPAHHPAPMSPSEEMFSRMESLSAALADGYKRWARRAPS